MERDLARINSTLVQRPFLDDTFLDVFWKNYAEIKAIEVERQFREFEMHFIVAEVVDELVSQQRHAGNCHGNQQLTEYMKIRFTKGIHTKLLVERILYFGIVLVGIRIRNQRTNVIE